jgi:hypothetical protein
VNAGLKYSLGRLALFVVVVAVLLPVPVPLLIKLMMALIISAPLSFVLLKRWRLEFGQRIDGRVRRRRERRDQLRAMLRGD